MTYFNKATHTFFTPVFVLLMAFGLRSGQLHSADGHDHSAHDHSGHDHGSQGSEKRVPINDAVKRNLGLVFAKAEYRSTLATRTLNGHFELVPSAQHHYPLPATGRVTVLVKPLQEIKEGQLIAEIDAPAWRKLQQELSEASSSLTQANAEKIRAEAAQKAAGDIEGVQEELNVYAAEVKVALAKVGSAKSNYAQLLLQASTLTGLSVKTLEKSDDKGPNWAKLQSIPIRSVCNGVVQEIDAATGTWVAEGTEVIHVVDPNQLRFRAKALQADVYDSLRNGLRVHIVPPTAKGDLRTNQSVQGMLRLGVTGDPEIRTTDVFVDFGKRALPIWARPKLSAVAKVVTAGSLDDEELSIPTRAIIQDGLDTVYFLVDPENENSVIRKVADMGPSDGKWTTIYSGLTEEDQVVVDGVYQLKLATSAQATKGGHFEADGTWHEGGEH